MNQNTAFRIEASYGMHFSVPIVVSQTFDTAYEFKLKSKLDRNFSKVFVIGSDMILDPATKTITLVFEDLEAGEYYGYLKSASPETEVFVNCKIILEVSKSLGQGCCNYEAISGDISVDQIDGVLINVQGGGATGISNETDQYVVAGEDINSYSPIAVISDRAYKYNAYDPEHMFAFAGFAKTSALSGGELKVQYDGFLELNGWGLIQGQQYLASNSGTLTVATTEEYFKKVIAYAISENKIKIINDNNPIIIN